MAGQSPTFAQDVSLTQINGALASCPSGQTVFLNPGTYTLAGGIEINTSNVTLRGAGADQTTLVAGGGGYNCRGFEANVCVQGSSGWSGNPDHAANWTGTTEGGPGNYPAGATHLTLSSVTGLSVGSTVILDQADDAADGFPQAGDIFVCGVGGSCVGQGTHAGRTGRGQEQIVTVAAISGTTVTVTPPIAMPNWRSSQNPGAWWANTIVRDVGIEDLTLDNGAGKGALCPGCGNIIFFNATNSWVTGIRSIEQNGTGGNPLQSHMRLYQASHMTVQDSYLYGSDNASQSYGIELFASSDTLTQNNICQHVTACNVINGPDSGSVIAYNFSIDDNYTARGNAPQWMQVSLWHEIGQSMELYEGNSSLGFQTDNIHGTHQFGTYFRNHYYGDIWNNPPKNNNTELVHLWKYSRFFNVIGNVLGRSGYYSAYQGTSPTSIFNVNGDSDGENNESTANDPRVAATLFRWGNYDTVTGAAHFTASEVPSAITNYSNPVPANTALPPSFYLTGEPSWWAFPGGTASPFPAIGPDVNSGNGPGGHSYYIPAENCWYKVMHGMVGVSGLLSFNADKCYPPSTSRPAPPTDLQFTVQ
jgi:hypothetical protein